MIKKYLPWYLLALVILSLAFIYGCGSAATSGGGSTTSNRTGVYSYSGSQPSGDAWSWTISTSEVIGTNETTGMWLLATWVTLPSGFGKATVVTSDGTDAPHIGGQAYFLEYPGTALLIHPAHSGNDRIMVCASAATLEPDDGRYVFVNIPNKNWSSTDAALGTVEADQQPSLNEFKFTTTDYLITGEKVQDNPQTGKFLYTNGVFTDEVGGPMKIFMTPSGMFIGDGGPGQGSFVGGKANVNTADFQNLAVSSGNHYKGVRFIFYPSGTGETEPVTCSYFSTHTMKAQKYADVDTGSVGNNGYVIITFEASSVPGFMEGHVTGFDQGGGTHSEFLQCVASKVHSDRLDKDLYLLFGVGRDDTDRAYNFLMIQTP